MSASPTPFHGRIYQAITRRIEAGQLADAVTLKAEFEHSGVLEEVGGTAYLAQLLSAMVGIIHAGEYSRGGSRRLAAPPVDRYRRDRGEQRPWRRPDTRWRSAD
jgi:hypothetical protein